MRKKFIYVLWALVVGVLLVIALIFTAIAKGWIGYVPPIEELENPNLKFATEIISDDGKMLGTWSLSKENRVFVGYDQLSSNLIRALIATEDERFAEHSGIDARAFVRALVKRGVMMFLFPIGILQSPRNTFHNLVYFQHYWTLFLYN